MAQPPQVIQGLTLPDNVTRSAIKGVNKPGYYNRVGVNAGDAVAKFNQRSQYDLSNPYEAAQNSRDFHQSEGFKDYFDPLDPSTALSDKLGTQAYNFRKGLIGTQNDAANDIRHQAGGLLDQGIKTIRAGASNRGLLYSGIRQSAEGDFRGKVANTMASQIAGSNADLSKRADSMDNIAAEAKMKGAQASMQAQNAVDQMNRENEVMRAQQMQQLTGAIGYGLGRGAYSLRGGQSSTPTNTTAGESYRDTSGLV